MGWDRGCCIERRGDSSGGMGCDLLIILSLALELGKSGFGARDTIRTVRPRSSARCM